jgi:hypothetical protein
VQGSSGLSLEADAVDGGLTYVSEAYLHLPCNISFRPCCRAWVGAVDYLVQPTGRVRETRRKQLPKEGQPLAKQYRLKLYSPHRVTCKFCGKVIWVVNHNPNRLIGMQPQ